MILSIVRGMALTLAATITVPGVAMAQDATGRPATAPLATAPLAAARLEQASPPAPGPSLWMIGGITTLAFAYVPAAVVAATSGVAIDRTLFVPVFGPWIDLTQRPACAGSVCSDKGSKDLLVIDGALQAASVLATLFGWVSAPAESATVGPSASVRPTIRVSPAAVGANGHGMIALGTF